MGTRLVLVIELDGGTPAEVAAYGDQLAADIERKRLENDDETLRIEWKAGQTRAVRIESDR